VVSNPPVNRKGEEEGNNTSEGGKIILCLDSPRAEKERESGRKGIRNSMLHREVQRPRPSKGKKLKRVKKSRNLSRRVGKVSITQRRMPEQGVQLNRQTRRRGTSFFPRSDGVRQTLKFN